MVVAGRGQARLDALHASLVTGEAAASAANVGWVADAQDSKQVRDVLQVADAQDSKQVRDVPRVLYCRCVMC